MISSLTSGSLMASHAWNLQGVAGFAVFLSAALLLDAFDISLPRGDSIGVSGAVCMAALFYLGFLPAVVVSVIAPLGAHWGRRGERTYAQLIPLMLSRAIALVAAGAAAWAVILAGGSEDSTGARLLIPAVYFLVEFAIMQCGLAIRSGRPLARLLRGAFEMQAPLIAAQWSATVLLLLIYPSMGAWSLVPVVALLLLMRQSAALLLQIRDAYRTTVEVLVEAAEGQDIGRVGHSERTAAIARQIATKMGFAGSQVERISYAALLHDLDALTGYQVPVGADNVDGLLSVVHSSTVLEDVEFFADVLPIVRICDGIADVDPCDPDILPALVVALASDIDALEHETVGLLHVGQMCGRVASMASPAMKSQAVSAALLLGHKTPAVI